MLTQVGRLGAAGRQAHASAGWGALGGMVATKQTVEHVVGAECCKVGSDLG
jgi:hypothetical protein